MVVYPVVKTGKYKVIENKSEISEKFCQNLTG